MEIGNFHNSIAPNSISDDSSKAQQFGPPLWRQETGRSSTVERTKQPLQSHQHEHTRNRLEEVWRSRVPWDDRVLEPTKSGIKRHCKQEAARKTTLSHAPGHEVLQSFLQIPRVYYYRTKSFAKTDQ